MSDAMRFTFICCKIHSYASYLRIFSKLNKVCFSKSHCVFEKVSKYTHLGRNRYYIKRFFIFCLLFWLTFVKNFCIPGKFLLIQTKLLLNANDDAQSIHCVHIRRNVNRFVNWTWTFLIHIQKTKVIYKIKIIKN